MRGGGGREEDEDDEAKEEEDGPPPRRDWVVAAWWSASIMASWFLGTPRAAQRKLSWATTRLATRRERRAGRIRRPQISRCSLSVLAARMSATAERKPQTCER